MGLLMDLTTFEDALKRDGFQEILTAGFAAAHDLGDHAHPYALRALVIDGEFRITVDGKETVYRPGEIFALASGVQHTERTGPEGAKFLIGRKR
jgi:quercetin dioxygenase-like cupin family protein